MTFRTALRLILLIFLSVILVACSGADESAAPPPPTQEVAAEQPVTEPATTVAEPVVTEEATASAVPDPGADTPTALPAATDPPETSEPVFNGQTADGPYFRGAANAPVTLIEYSDFL